MILEQLFVERFKIELLLNSFSSFNNKQRPKDSMEKVGEQIAGRSGLLVVDWWAAINWYIFCTSTTLECEQFKTLLSYFSCLRHRHTRMCV